MNNNNNHPFNHQILNHNHQMQKQGAANHNPVTIWDLFSRPLTDIDFFTPNRGESFKVDIRDLGNAYELKADLPGVKKEDISLNFNQGVLAIEAVHHKAEDKNEHGFLMHERTEGVYERAFALDDGDENAISASFENGTLLVIVNKKAIHAGRSIEVK